MDGRHARHPNRCQRSVGDIEIIAYHWHPGRGGLSEPHAHVRRYVHPLPLGRVHFPTGFVSLAQFAQLLIREFGVVPRTANREQTLHRAERQSPATRIWHEDVGPA